MVPRKKNAIPILNAPTVMIWVVSLPAESLCSKAGSSVSDNLVPSSMVLETSMTPSAVRT